METLKDRLIRTEGKRNKIYRDTSDKIGFEGKKGKVTVGVGYNIDDLGLPDDIIMMLLDRTIQKATDDLLKYLPWTGNIDWPRKSVLIDMCFNMGIGDSTKGLLSFKNTLKLIEEGKYTEASDNMLKSKWATQVGSRAANLARIMKTGEM